jgi:hypothetical protein
MQEGKMNCSYWIQTYGYMGIFKAQGLNAGRALQHFDVFWPFELQKKPLLGKVV